MITQLLAEGGQALPPAPSFAAVLVVWLSGRRSRPSGGQAGGLAAVTNINDVLDGHVSLDLDCVDRVYLNAYVPTLQVGGPVNRFLHDHLGQPVASPASSRGSATGSGGR